MELKVWVEGIQRIVCGVTVNTTCQDVVFALAHATGKVGRFTLIERWRNNERLLAPNENPLKLLLKWGEYANDVQFILQRSEQNTQKSQQQQQQQQQQQAQHGQQHQLQQAESIASSNNNINNDRNSQTNAVMKKPLGFSNNNNTNNNLNNNLNISNNHNKNNNTNKTNNNSNNYIDSAKNSSSQHRKQQSDENITIKDLRKSFGAHDGKQMENVGIVKGVPQRVNTNRLQQATTAASTLTSSPQQRISPQITPPKHEKSHSNPIQMPHTQPPNNNSSNNSNNNNNNNNEDSINQLYAQIGPKSKSINAINLAEVRNSLDRGTGAASPEIMFTTNAGSSNENLLDMFNGNFTNNNNSSMEQQQIYTNNVTPTISANGALVPPPYRDPPPPRNSPLQAYKSSNSSDHSACQNSPACQTCNGSMMHDIAAHSAGVCSNPFLNDYNDFDVDLQGGGGGGNVNSVVGMAEESESIFQATQYNDLLTLIKFQREKITLQQSELSKYDAEIVYLESKERDQVQELEAISREITKADQIFRQGSEQLQTLQYVEEENELVKQQEKTLKSEIALLRSKLANCETELLQCKNKIRILMDDIEIEQRAISNKQKSNRQNVERDFLIEMERIQSEIDQAIHNTDTSNKTTENLKKEILLIENAIAEKKRQVEKLVNEMKEVNLQSLTVTTSEEIKHLLEGSNKPGSSRRIIGSPRQLENAVPTSKNPHGVWV